MTSDCILSLTSIPPRFDGLGPVLASLLAQDVDAIELWIPQSYARFPDWSGALPVVPAGVRIMRCDKDYGPATKYLPALDVHPRSDAIFCDDDAIYLPGWAKKFRDFARENPTQVPHFFAEIG